MKKPVFTGACTALVTPFSNGKVDYSLLLLVVLVIADERLFDAEMIQKLHRDARVLRSDEIRARERFGGAR